MSEEKRLEEAALRYLERFAASTSHMRQILRRRVRRQALRDGTEPDLAQASPAIDAVVEKLVRLGLLNDRLYAETKSGSLHRRGASARKIAAALAAKGIGADIVREVLNTEDTETGLASRPGGDLAAAAALARRRRLGPYRLPELRETMALKDLGSLARAGFSRRIAEQILACSDTDALLALVQENAG